jgi:hypothetical protein
MKKCDYCGAFIPENFDHCMNPKCPRNPYSSNSSGGSSSSGGCYVATCVYGSYDCPEVWTLRRFRDFSLQHRLLGKKFIRAYYRISPKIVKRCGHKKWFNRMMKPIVDRLVAKLQNKGVESSPYCENERD